MRAHGGNLSRFSISIVYSLPVIYAVIWIALPAWAHLGFRLIGAEDLLAMMNGSQADHTRVYDANGIELRKKEGVIRGAELLTSYKDYPAEKVLPKDHDANLVFYCANERCLASHDAAKKAVQAGYSHVFVMKDGIQGWKKAGYPVE